MAGARAIGSGQGLGSVMELVPLKHVEVGCLNQTFEKTTHIIIYIYIIIIKELTCWSVHSPLQSRSLLIVWRS